MSGVIKFGAIFFSEDVRDESTGKVILIGTYTGGFKSTVSPGNLYVHLIAIFRASDAGEARAEIVVKLGEKNLADAEIDVVADRAGNVFCVFPQLPIEDVEADSELTVDVRLDGGDWERGFYSPFTVPRQDDSERHLEIGS